MVHLCLCYVLLCARVVFRANPSPTSGPLGPAAQLITSSNAVLIKLSWRVVSVTAFGSQICYSQKYCKSWAGLPINGGQAASWRPQGPDLTHFARQQPGTSQVPMALEWP